LNEQATPKNEDTRDAMEKEETKSNTNDKKKPILKTRTHAEAATDQAHHW
jgi:hypothetical protein